MNAVPQKRLLHALGRREIDFQILIELRGSGGKDARPNT
jgi:hypothetical protein